MCVCLCVCVRDCDLPSLLAQQLHIAAGVTAEGRAAWPNGLFSQSVVSLALGGRNYRMGVSLTFASFAKLQLSHLLPV